MTIAITGSSGLIGSALTKSLRADNIDVIRLVRRAAAAADEVSWDPDNRTVDVEALAAANVDAIVHLAGAGVGDRRWTDEYKAEILDSRVNGTTAIAEAAAQLPNKPALISGSAIGYYGDTGDDIVDESAAAGASFLADVVVAWEAAADPARDAGLRVAHPRTGLVVAESAGAFGKLVPIFKLGGGGKLGSGKQWWSFISLTDEVRALRFLVDNPISGPANLVAPVPVRNKDAATALGDVLHRPSLLPVPHFALRIAIGEFADEVMASQGVTPSVLTEAGFEWLHPDIHGALAAEITPSSL